MKLSTILVILGFCVGTLGATGFYQTPVAEGAEGADPPAEADVRHTQPGAWYLFGGGLAILGVGALLGRLQRKQSGDSGDGHATARVEFRGMIEGLRDSVVALDDRRAELESFELRTAIDELFSGPWFDLSSRHEELAAVIGVSAYADVWDGVATSERLLARAWSMATDGHLGEAVLELPHAREAIEHAAAAMATS